MAFDWTDEQIAELKEKWAEGKSATVIAAEFGDGVTRNAVLGKAHRLGLPTHHTVTTAHGPRAVKEPSVRAPRVAKSKPDPKKIAELQEFMDRAPSFAEVIAAPVPLNMTLLDLNHNNCRWPVSGEKADMLFCGRDADAASVYCTYHHRLSKGTGTRSERMVDSLIKKVA
jgi:GcrA cell cycle regulator